MNNDKDNLMMNNIINDLNYTGTCDKPSRKKHLSQNTF